MTVAKKIESLTKFLKIVSDNENVFIKKDEITGQRFAIAEKNTVDTSISVKSNFMTYKEAEAFLFGVMITQQNRINFKKQSHEPI